MFLWPQDRRGFITQLHEELDDVLHHDLIDIVLGFDDRFTRRSGTFNIIVGGRHTGKSTIMKHIVLDEFLHRKDISEVHAFAGTTAAYNEFNSYLAKNVYFYSGPEMELGIKSVPPKLSDHEKTLILIDGIMPDWLRSNAAHYLTEHCRYYGFVVLVTGCCYQDIPPFVRSSADSWFILREHSTERPRTYKMLVSSLPTYIDTFAKFEEVLQAATENYGALVVDTHSMAPKVSCFRPKIV